MIAKGLKVGETFVDGKYLYEIIAIDSQGRYVSSLVGKAGEGAKTPKKAVEPMVEVKETKSLDDIPYSELKKLAKEQGVSAKGSKEELIDRLKGV